MFEILLMNRALCRANKGLEEIKENKPYFSDSQFRSQVKIAKVKVRKSTDRIEVRWMKALHSVLIH